MLRPHLPYRFEHELPYDAVDEMHPLDVLSADGRVYRLHVSPAAGTYFMGWVEQLPRQSP